MKKDLLDILCCPTCKAELELEVEKEENGEILSGTLLCKKCKALYLITDGIPDFLPK
ncbi:MAG TPA: Trm112 family protein [Thermoplasmata archaeon]|nr:Trm112 family protein [Thermoplasmata archaeon]